MKDEEEINKRLKDEETIRKRVIQELGVKLEKRKVQLEGIDEEWQPDGVSDDNTIVLEVKTAGLKEHGNAGTAIARYLLHPYILLKHVVGAKRRILVFTNKRLFDHVTNCREGKLAMNDGIEIKLMEIE